MKTVTIIRSVSLALFLTSMVSVGYAWGSSILISQDHAMAETKFEPDKSRDVKSQLQLEKMDERLIISGNVTNKGSETGEFQYQLKVKREGRAGRSETSQSGTLTLDPDQISEISETSVNVQNHDTCTISLNVINNAGQVVSESNLIYKVSNSD